ncbi:hypothetical protein AAVH_10943 [Aphelenchoides avenae]|nr:hypothetical protein AAVH_10943 [Aphelenchus avenae]
MSRMDRASDAAGQCRSPFATVRYGNAAGSVMQNVFRNFGIQIQMLGKVERFPSFHSVSQRNAGVLARRRRMKLVIDDATVFLIDGGMTIELDYDLGMPFTIVNAMRYVASRVGFHSLTSLRVTTDWRRLPVHRLFYASPDLQVRRNFVARFRVEQLEHEDRRRRK